MQKKYGCYNRERKAGYCVLVRQYYPDSPEYRMVPSYIPDTLSKGCGYDRWATDERCRGCNHAGKGGLVCASTPQKK